MRLRLRKKRRVQDSPKKGVSFGGGAAQILAAAAPLALAIAVFGTIYGAAARPLLGAWKTIVSSAVIFSGALQFAVVGLLLAGASAAAMLLTAVVLNLRHVLLGAALRPSLRTTPLRRAGLAWWLIDETAGLALTTKSPTATLMVGGLLCYSAWVAGTALGVVGGALTSLRGVATAVFPVLFVGLAVIAAERRDLVLRSVLAAAVTVALGIAFPAARGVLPAIVAVVVSLPGDDR